MKKILLVDDSATMLMSMTGVLTRLGYKVEAQENGPEALQAIENFKPDLMITDLNMPGMNGIELIKEAKAKPTMRFKPVLMLTTESQQERRAEAKAAGAVGWLVKPVSPERLAGVIKQVLPGA